MKICCIAHAADSGGGADRSFVATLDALAAHGLECAVVLPKDGPLVAEIARRRLPHAIVPHLPWLGVWWPPRRRVGRLLRNLRGARQIAQQVRRWGCDLVYTNSLQVPAGALAAALARRPHVWHIREFGIEDHGAMFEWGQTCALRAANALTHSFVVNSKAVAAKFARWIPPGKIHVVYQGVEVRDGPLPDGVAPAARFRCVLAGAIHEGKRQEDAVRAVAELARAGLDLELLLVGSGAYAPYFPVVQALVRELGVGDRVRFTGPVANAFPVMRSADVVLLCSRCEAFGRVTVEGMLAGKPVIGTRSGGTPELIRDGETGLLYDVGDVRALAAQIRRLYEQPGERGRIGAQARQWAEDRFTLRRYGDEMAALLRAAGGPVVSC